MISALAFMIVYFKLLYSMWVQTHLHCITNLNQVLKPWLDQSSIKGGSQNEVKLIYWQASRVSHIKGGSRNEAILFSMVAHKNEIKLIYWRVNRAFMIVDFQHVNADSLALYQKSVNQVLKSWLDQSSIKGGSQNEAILFSRVAHKNEDSLALYQKSVNQVLKSWLDQSSIKGGSQNEAILFSRVAHKNEVKLIYWPAFYNESLKLLWLSISSMWMQTHLHCIRNQSTRFYSHGWINQALRVAQIKGGS